MLFYWSQWLNGQYLNWPRWDASLREDKNQRLTHLKKGIYFIIFLKFLKKHWEGLPLRLIFTVPPPQGQDSTMCERVIAHLDMDCFYCQVEHRRLGIPTEVPLGVQQASPSRALAANSPDFDFFNESSSNPKVSLWYIQIKRGMTSTEAKKICPEIRCIHVELIGDGGETVSEGAPRSKAKVTLRRYRRASAEVMEIFERIIGPTYMQRTSIDEAYLDLTSKIKTKLSTIDYQPPSLTKANIPSSMRVGAQICDTIRKAVRKELGFTVSAGIAVNKIVAKMASSKNKPDKQTVIPPDRTKTMIHSLPLRDIPGLGGKTEKMCTNSPTYLKECDYFPKCSTFVTVNKAPRNNSADKLKSGYEVARKSHLPRAHRRIPSKKDSEIRDSKPMSRFLRAGIGLKKERRLLRK
eukprot:jgi/Bigna1/138867/aug1.47_g13575